MPETRDESIDRIVRLISNPDRIDRWLFWDSDNGQVGFSDRQFFYGMAWCNHVPGAATSKYGVREFAGSLLDQVQFVLTAE